jgi:hypothetical protein
MTDQFANWRKALAGEKVPVYETEPNAGYYRKPITEKTAGGATKKIGWEPVAFWYADNGELQCLTGVRSYAVARDKAIELWLWVAKYPISEELYFAVTEQGAPWPDMPHEPIAQPSEPVGIEAEIAEENAADNAPPPIGHNKGPELDPLAAMREQISNAVGAAMGSPRRTRLVWHRRRAPGCWSSATTPTASARPRSSRTSTPRAMSTRSTCRW